MSQRVSVRHRPLSVGSRPAGRRSSPPPAAVVANGHVPVPVTVTTRRPHGRSVVGGGCRRPYRRCARYPRCRYCRHPCGALPAFGYPAPSVIEASFVRRLTNARYTAAIIAASNPTAAKPPKPKSTSQTIRMGDARHDGDGEKAARGERCGDRGLLHRRRRGSGGRVTTTPTRMVRRSGVRGGGWADGGSLPRPPAAA